MGVKLGLSHYGETIGWGCCRTGCWVWQEVTVIKGGKMGGECGTNGREVNCMQGLGEGAGSKEPIRKN